MQTVVRPRRFRERVFHQLEGESMTERSHADQTDINVIVSRYRRSGDLPPPQTPPIFMDVTALQGDYRQRLAHLQRVKADLQMFYEAEAAAAEAALAAEQAAITPPDAPPAS